eukprot:1225684-Rhodomonas_salina.1
MDAEPRASTSPPVRTASSYARPASKPLCVKLAGHASAQTPPPVHAPLSSHRTPLFGARHWPPPQSVDALQSTLSPSPPRQSVHETSSLCAEGSCGSVHAREMEEPETDVTRIFATLPGISVVRMGPSAGDPIVSNLIAAA